MRIKSCSICDLRFLKACFPLIIFARISKLTSRIIQKMDEDNHSIDSPAQSNPGTPLPSNPGTPRNDKNDDIALVSSTSCYPIPQSSSGSSRQQPKPKYSQLLAIIEELGKDIRPTYAGSRSSAERLKRGIVHARILVRECLMETERNART